MKIDGDVASIVAPSEHYSDVLNDPFGFKILKTNKKHAASNRYFSHITMVYYFKSFQNAISPLFKDKIVCIYFLIGFFNLLIKAFLIGIISIYITGKFKLFSLKFLLSAAIIAPFFIQQGFYTRIGIVDNSVTYTFFYALPIGLTLIYFMPFYLSYKNNKSITYYFKPILWPIWALLAVYLSFSGPIVAPTVILSSTIILAYKSISKSENLKFISLFKSFIKNPTPLLFALIGLSLLCLYSFYIGKFNVENSTDVSLVERYFLLLKGLPKFIFYKPTFIIIAVFLGVNFYILQKHYNLLNNKPIINVLKVLVISVSIYILMLPLGGYRHYRPWIVRYDTFLPVTIIIVYLIGLSTIQILELLIKKNIINKYLGLLIMILIIFTLVDKPNFENNDCQQNALYTISKSKKKVIELNKDCNVMSWTTMNDPKYSKHIGDMLYYWGITDKPILFYQK